MKTKQTEYTVIGLVVGIIAGCLVGLGELNWIKKSQRETMALPIVGSTAIIGAGIGFKAGNSLGRNRNIDIQTGIADAKENLYQQGRGWIAIAEWTNKEDVSYKLITGQAGDKTLISQLNGQMILNHKIKSGSQVNVSKAHKEARNYIFSQQMAQHK